MMPNPLHRAARQYADRGWSVLPLHSLSLDGACTCSRGADCASPGNSQLTATPNDLGTMGAFGDQVGGMFGFGGW